MKSSRIIATITALLTASLMAGCVHLNSVSQTQIPAKRTNPISAEASKFIFFGFNFNNDFVIEVSEKLAKQCEGGEVRGILTKDEVVNYFIGLAITRRVVATGFCVKA